MKKISLILISAFLLLGAISVVLSIFERVAWDKNFKNVMLVFDGDAFSILGKAGVFFDFPENSAISVSEATLASLTSLGYVQYPPQVNGFKKHVKIKIPRALLFDEPIVRKLKSAQTFQKGNIADILSMSLRKVIFDTLSYQVSGIYDVTINLSEQDVEIELILPLMPEEEEEKLSIGIYLHPEVPHPKRFGYLFRPSGNGLFTEEGIREKLNLVPESPEKNKIIIFQGDSVLGYPNNLPFVAKELEGHLGVPEFSEVEGLAQLSQLVAPEKVFWVHSITPSEVAKMNTDEILARYLRAVKERNPRILYIRPLSADTKKLSDDTLAQKISLTNKEFISQLRKKLQDELGMELSLDLSNPMAFLPLWLKPFIMMLIFLFLILFFWLFFPQSKIAQYLIHPIMLLLAFGLFILSLYFPPEMTLLTEGLGLLMALTAPQVGVNFAYSYLSHRQKNNASKSRLNPISHSLIAFGVVMLLSLAGGLIIFALYHSISVFTKVEVFRGVVLARVLPVFLALFYSYELPTLVTKPIEKNFYTRVDRVFGFPVTYLDLTLILLLFAVLALAVVRAGNEFGFLVSTSERSFRSTLEALFGIRPRNTELIGHLSFIWYFVLLRTYHRSLLLLLAIGMLGMTSVVNTFCHFHTAFQVSFLRATFGLFLSLLAFVLSYIIVQIFCFLLRRVKLYGVGGNA